MKVMNVGQAPVVAKAQVSHAQVSKASAPAVSHAQVSHAKAGKALNVKG